MKSFYVYILCNKRNETLYTGITSNLVKRIYEHKNNLIKGFSQKYNIHSLVWYELHDAAETAITREKQIKTWKRQWKMRLIEKNNPEWNDLYDTICEETGFLPAQE
jgi:putative endonuclease